MAEDLSGPGRARPGEGRHDVAPHHPAPGGLEARTTLPDRLVRVVPGAWCALWIVAFATGNWQVGLLLLLLTGPLTALVRGPRGSVRRQQHRDRHRAERRALYDRRVLERDQRRQGHEVVRGRTVPSGEAGGGRWSWQPSAGWGPAPRPPSAPEPPVAAVRGEQGGAERSLAAAVAAARTGPNRLDDDALALVDRLDATLRPMLARARQGGVDVLVRQDLEAIATEHLPETLRAYQHLPAAYAHEHRAADGRTPAEELRSQLELLVEGCGPMRDAVHGADVARQRELGRFLEAKFRRSDLDL